VSPELSQLIELQELDLEILRISDRLARIPAERDQIEEEFNRRASEFLALKETHRQTLEQRTQLEQELVTTQIGLEKFEQDKTRVRNEKEYTAVLREIDVARKHVGALETEIIRLMEEAEKLDSIVNEKSPEVEHLRSQVDQTLEALDSEKIRANRQLEEFTDRRANLAKHLPKNLFNTYDRMSRLRRGQALAEVSSEGICAVCRMRVRPKVFSDVRKGDQLITCENCGRILYYRNETTQSAEAATGTEIRD
jgi:predicted  nucleic acid-binding Zn-ribbon protein